MNICVYCSSSNAIPAVYIEAARAMGLGMARRGWPLVFGGGSVGLMGMVAATMHEAGGHVIGVIPQGLLDREIGYIYADELIVTNTLRERKQIMDDRADAFVALAGGFGTLEELLEIMTLRQLEYHKKPIIIVNTDGYYDPLLAQFERLFEQGFTHERYRSLYNVVPTSEMALELLEQLEGSRAG